MNVNCFPEDWEQVYLNEIVEQGRLPSGLYKDKALYGSGTKIIKLGDVFNFDEFAPELAQRVLLSEDEKRTHSVEVGDIFIALASVKLEGVGKVMLVTSLDEPTAFDHNVALIRPVSKVDSKFLAFLFRSETVRSLIAKNATQVGTTFLKASTILSFALPIPPMYEQTAIANALSDVDALIQELEKLIAKKQAIKTATMQQLLTGRTRLPQFAHHPDGRKKGYKPSELGEIPEDWEVKTILELGQVSTGGTPSTSTAEFWNGDVPWITPTDISHSKNIYSSERKISQKGLKSIRPLPANTVLVTCIASIGKNAVLRRDGACNQQINAVVPYEHIDVDFLFYAIELSSDRLKASAGITATLIVSKALFEEFQLVIPVSPEEQEAISVILNEMDENIQSLEKHLSKTRQIKQGMMQELLTGKTRLIKPSGAA
ncbi:restriction endonuclease subunit S [Vibrio cholerae]|uniref:restriction endonuclease subunit S n=1 Tax=Vibrio TaxID=662 RepID=UPI0011D9173E|nr:MULTISPECIES: restriction endonuclease subunit S [Vibrio]EGQ9324477.1 restriction endonuclease subunit S [Vibrio cholerae]EGR0520572.1 restriction endonuclease subunit S [Vibrio cholerae]EHD7130304.1 restriction endonuclease subunit S [Vibrio cholerae]EKC3494666.1 restriction endonuclease subunit S [Vibrio cholerae]EKZ8641429.1 restriction endonuclease subunit S [Vibrio cholerae]